MDLFFLLLHNQLPIPQKQKAQALSQKPSLQRGFPCEMALDGDFCAMFSPLAGEVCFEATKISLASSTSFYAWDAVTQVQGGH